MCRCAIPHVFLLFFFAAGVVVVVDVVVTAINWNHPTGGGDARYIASSFLSF